MITYDEALKSALEYSRSDWDRLVDARENDRYYFILGSDGYEGVVYGETYLIISKDTGDISLANLCERDQREMIKEASVLDIPNEYRKNTY